MNKVFELNLNWICFLYVASAVDLKPQLVVEELPVAVPHDCLKPIDLPPEQKPTVIRFDIETTNLSQYCSVVFIQWLDEQLGNWGIELTS